MSRDELITRGFEKKVLELNTREARRLGLLSHLVRKELEKHFEDLEIILRAWGCNDNCDRSRPANETSSTQRVVKRGLSHAFLATSREMNFPL